MPTLPSPFCSNDSSTLCAKGNRSRMLHSRRNFESDSDSQKTSGKGRGNEGGEKKIRGVRGEGTPTFFSPPLSLPYPTYALSLGQSRHKKEKKNATENITRCLTAQVKRRMCNIPTVKPVNMDTYYKDLWKLSVSERGRGDRSGDELLWEGKGFSGRFTLEILNLILILKQGLITIVP